MVKGLCQGDIVAWGKGTVPVLFLRWPISLNSGFTGMINPFYNKSIVQCSSPSPCPGLSQLGKNISHLSAVG